VGLGNHKKRQSARKDLCYLPMKETAERGQRGEKLHSKGRHVSAQHAQSKVPGRGRDRQRRPQSGQTKKTEKGENKKHREGPPPPSAEKKMFPPCLRASVFRDGREVFAENKIMCSGRGG